MSSSFLQYEIEKKPNRDSRSKRVHEKSIETVQVCIRCRKQFLFKHGRKNCPRCSGLLITKTTVFKEAKL